MIYAGWVVRLLFKVVALWMFICSVFVIPVGAREVFFDDFEKADTNRWVILNENAPYLQYITAPHNLYIANVDIDKALFVSMKNKISEFTVADNVTIEIRFRFINQAFGAGIAITDHPMLSRITYDPYVNEFVVGVWPQVGNRFAVTTSICLQSQQCSDASPRHSVNAMNKPIMSSLDEFNKWHILKVKYVDNHYEVSLDDSYSFVTLTTSRKPEGIWFGNPQITKTPVSFSHLFIDYVKIYDDRVEFSYFSQKDPTWASDEYDAASKWAGKDKAGIDRWGCALTSSAMVLKHYGIKSPNGQETTPKILNDWLKQQPDGYLRNGLLNWLAVTRYAKQAETNGQAPTALEFERTPYEQNKTYPLPSILGLPGHFVVAYDDWGSSFAIKDPADETKTQLQKTENINTVNTFVPSKTDLSYFMFVVNKEVKLTLKKATGQVVPLVSDDEYLQDDLEGSKNTGVTVYLLPKPNKGKYLLEIENPTQNEVGYLLDAYYYDKWGGVGKKTDKGWLDAGEKASFSFEYQGKVGVHHYFDIAYLRKLLARYKDRGLLKQSAYKKLDRYLKYAVQTGDESFRRRLMKAEKIKLEKKGAWFESERRDALRNKMAEWL